MSQHYKYIAITVMKTGLWAAFAITCFLTTLFAKPLAKNKFTLLIINARPFYRKSEVLRIKRNLFGKIDDGLSPVATDKKKILISQLVDSNNDGKWDELLVEVSMLPNSKDTLNITWINNDNSAGRFPLVANVRLSLKTKTSQPMPEIVEELRKRGFVQNIADPYYQMEGPGIENDKVAFRAFFDYRNGKDVYGKIVSKPILDQVGVTGSWHVLQPWGMDIWKVGKSIGAGAVGIMEGSKLYRLGDADTTVFQVLYKGSLAAAFKLQFTNWDAGTTHKNGSETVTITKGDFFYKDEIEISLNPDQYLFSGMGNFGIYPVTYTKHNGALSSIATYASQAESSGTNLGAAILFSSGAYMGHSTTSSTDSIPNTSYVVLKPVKSKTNVIYFLACWEKSDVRFSKRSGFSAYLKETARRLTNPIQVKMITKNIN